MENRIIKYFAMYGFPGLALFVFLVLMKMFSFSFSEIDPIWSAIIAILFILSVFLIVFFAIKYKSGNKSKSVLFQYEAFKKGLNTTLENVTFIEQIANSNDKNKKAYLENLLICKDLAWIEKDAIREALKCIEEKVNTDNLYEKVKMREWEKIEQIIIKDKSDNEVLNSIIKQLKYWRYINRRNHPDFEKVEETIMNVIKGQSNLEELKETISRISM